MAIKPWEELTIRDDYMFKLVMRRKHICKKMLELILQINIRDIRYIEEEKNLKFQYAGKGVRLDVYVADDKIPSTTWKCKSMNRQKRNWPNAPGTTSL